MNTDIRNSRNQPVDMPAAVIGNNLGAASSHPEYKAAKSGDIEAAFRLAKDLVSDKFVSDVRNLIGNSKPIIVPVRSIEDSGLNTIPRMVAEVLGYKLSLESDESIVQATSPKRTNLSGIDRLFASPKFAGNVESGADYLLLDDTLTQGATFAALEAHITGGGGRVVGAAALTGKQYSTKLKADPETLAKLYEQHGDIEDQFRSAAGYGFDALTQSEARYLANFRPIDAIRDRIAEAARQEG